MKKSLFSLSLVISATFLTNTLYAQFTTFTQTNGNIQFGPSTNSGYTEIYTNQSKFLFNKEIYITGGYGLSSYGTNNLFLKTNGSARMTILNSNGNVGIGTTFPTDKLHVLGNIYLPSDSKLKLGTQSATSGSFMIHNSACCYNTYADFSGSLFFRRLDSNGGGIGSLLGLQSDGTVTIGVWETYSSTVTNTQGHRLMVNGGILCEKIKVIADVPNSDHVFEKTYPLMSINDVKNYIEQHKHLPEVPSAKEFKDNGYNVGEMDDLLLRKVEELTLYVIKLNEEVEKLKVENEKLTNKVEK